MKKVLIITYYWPPSGGAGVQRWLRFSKYLPAYGWEPVILTVDQDKAAYPVTDLSLLAEVPSSIKVYKTGTVDWFRLFKKSGKNIPSAGFANNPQTTFTGRLLRFIRGNFFIPDPRKGWNRKAFRKACEIINSSEINNIITTSPPHSTQLIGLRLKKRYPSLNWIADLRDPWTDIYYYRQFYHLPHSLIIDRCLERNVLINSDKLITVGNSLANLLISKNKNIKDKLSVITNGFDPDDFKIRSTQLPDRFTLTYVGTISEMYPLDGLIEVLCTLQDRNIDFLLRFVGFSPASIRKKVSSKLTNSHYEFHDYVDHKTAVNFMIDSSLLLLIIPDHPTGKSILTGKLFEYIATGRMILCLGPEDGDAADIIGTNRSGVTFSPDDTSSIEKFITDYYRDPRYESEDPGIFSHRYLSGRLVKLFT